ncbi:hypothetical protein ERO13_D03G121350v2 [Gossypium hirsutum]|nr:hypothetical protein ERO13_D03G121350v2 [Gossypium hirsutum]
MTTLWLTHPFLAITVAQAYLDHIYKLHGPPCTIVSDRDRVFVSKFWRELFKRLSTYIHMSIDCHPQTDGQTEVLNRCLEAYLCCMIGEMPQD